MKIIGITGGIACGKSTVTRLFAERGAMTLSADDDARTVLQPDSPVYETVLSTFPEAARSDGTLDRARLAARIFAEPAARQRLEAITHPAIIALMIIGVSSFRVANEDRADALLAYETPLLYEAELEPLFDVVIAVIASPEVQAARLQAREASAGRPTLTADALAGRLSAQLPNEEKARRADYTIRTDGTIEETAAQVAAIMMAINPPRL